MRDCVIINPMVKMYLCSNYSQCVKAAGDIAQNYVSDPSGACAVFCEDKLTLSIEREIASRKGGSFGAEVYSFRRFIAQNVYRGEAILSKEGSVMAVGRVVGENADNLPVFRKSLNNPMLASTLYELIAQLQSAKVSADDLSNDAQKLPPELRGKIGDICTVYRAYTRFVEKGNYLDSNGYLALLPPYIAAGGFGGKAVVFCGYSSLTRQLFDIVSATAKRSDDTHIIVLFGDNDELYTNELYCAIMRVFPHVCIEDRRAEGQCAEAVALRERLFRPELLSEAGVETDKVFLYEAKTVEDELKHIASMITLRVKTGKIAYRNAVVAVGNINDYLPSVKKVFADYEIPFFADATKTLSAHPLSRLVLDYLNCAAKGYDVENLIKICKNIYFESDFELTDKFENYALKYALSRKSMAKPFTYEDESFDVGVLELVRQRLMEIALGAPVVGTPEQFRDNIFALLDTLCADAVNTEISGKLSEVSEAEAQYSLQAPAKLRTAISEICAIVGGVKMSVREYRNLLISGLNSIKISLAPLCCDNVYVCELKDCRLLNAKMLFAAGINGDVPFTKSDCALLNDRDLNRLEDFGCVVEPKISAVNRRERENVGIAFESFTEGLFVSYSLQSVRGNTLSRSKLIDYFERIFSRGGKLDVANAFSLSENATRAGRQNRYQIYKNIALKPAIANFLYSAARFKAGAEKDFTYPSSVYAAIRSVVGVEVDRLLAAGGKEMAQQTDRGAQLFFNKDNISASVLESYFACPNACFFANGLKLAERDSGTLKTNEYGTFVHSVLEKFTLRFAEVTDGNYAALVEQIADNLKESPEYARYFKNDDYRVLYPFMLGEVKRVCLKLISHFAHTRYAARGSEIWFSDSSPVYKAIKLQTSDGVKSLNGKVDRMDECDGYVNIIDYKTGVADAADEFFFTGNKLQLYLYMNVFTATGKKPSGAYYCSAKDYYIDEKADRGKLLIGKTLADDAVICSIDTDFESPDVLSSDYINVKFKPIDGKRKIDAKAETVLDSEQFDKYLRYARKVAENGANELIEGFIAPTPYANQCEYCKYACLCVPPEKRASRKLKGIKKSSVVRAIDVDEQAQNKAEEKHGE